MKNVVKQAFVFMVILVLWTIPFAVFCKEFGKTMPIQHVSIVAVVWWLIGISIIGVIMENMSKVKQYKRWN